MIFRAPTSPQERLSALLDVMPIRERMCALAISVIADDPHAGVAVKSLVAMAQLMGGNLSPRQRSELAWFMRGEADELDGLIH